MFTETELIGTNISFRRFWRLCIVMNPFISVQHNVKISLFIYSVLYFVNVELFRLRHCSLWDVGCLVWDVDCSIWDIDTGSSIWDIGCLVWDVDCSIWDVDTGSSIWDVGCLVWDVDCSIWDVGCLVLDVDSSIWDVDWLNVVKRPV